MMVCPSGVWPQMLMPWYVVGSQVFSSTTIGFQPTSHSKPDGVVGVVGQLLVVGVLSDCQRHVEAEFLDPLIGGGHVVEVGDLDVEVLDRVRIGLRGSRFTAAIATEWCR